MLCPWLLKHKTWRQMEVWKHSSVHFKLGTESRRVVSSRCQLLQSRKKKSWVSFGYEAEWAKSQSRRGGGEKNPLHFPWIQLRLFFYPTYIFVITLFTSLKKIQPKISFENKVLLSILPKIYFHFFVRVSSSDFFSATSFHTPST
jgi:hypothetical protein